MFELDGVPIRGCSILPIQIQLERNIILFQINLCGNSNYAGLELVLWRVTDCNNTGVGADKYKCPYDGSLSMWNEFSAILGLVNIPVQAISIRPLSQRESLSVALVGSCPGWL